MRGRRWSVLAAVVMVMVACSRGGNGDPAASQPAPIAPGARELLPPLYRVAARDGECNATFPRFYAYRPARDGDVRSLVAIVWLDGTMRPEEPVHAAGDPRVVRARCMALGERGGVAAAEWCCR